MAGSAGGERQSISDELVSRFPIVGEKLAELLDCPRDALAAYLEEVSARARIEDTDTHFSAYYLRRDGNGEVRVNDLARFLRTKLVNYAIPESRIRRAHEHYVDSGGDFSECSKLEAEAKSLFVDMVSGEGGEVLLYVLAESELGLPQVLCKMPLKTNPRMHCHGVDGVHASVDEESGNLALYWGESKLYKSLSEAVTDCFESIAPFLEEGAGGGASSDRDLLLLRDHVDFNDAELEAAFRRYLDPDDVAHLKLEVRGICLVGFDFKSYPDAFVDKARVKLDREIEKAIKRWRKSVGNRVGKCKLKKVHIEALCVPFPSIDEFRKAFLREVT